MPPPSQTCDPRKSLCLPRPQSLYLDSGINSPQESLGWGCGVRGLINASSQALTKAPVSSLSPDYAPSTPSSVLSLPQPASVRCWEMETSPAKRSWEGCRGPCQQPELSGWLPSLAGAGSNYLINPSTGPRLPSAVSPGHSTVDRNSSNSSWARAWETLPTLAMWT